MKPRILLALPDLRAYRGELPHFQRVLCFALDELAPGLGLEIDVVTLRVESTNGIRSTNLRTDAEIYVAGGNVDFLRKVCASAAARRPDLLLLGAIGWTPLGVACLPFLRRGFGFLAQGAECLPEEASCETRWSRLAAARRAAFVFAASRHAGRRLGELSGLRARSILLLPQALAPDRLDDDAGRSGTGPAPAQELLSVSPFCCPERMRGLEHAIRAFAALAPGHPAARYRIVGGGEDRSRLEQLAVSLGVGHRVIFEDELGDRELADRYRRCAAFVLPSREEGSGVVFLEAMRFARACVGADHGGTPELIEDSETGYLVPFGEVKALAAVLGRLLAAPELCLEHGLAGRRRWEEQFTFDRFRERLQGHLSDLLERD